MPIPVKDGTGATQYLAAPSGCVCHYAGTAFSLAVATPTAVIVVKASATKTLYLHRVSLRGAATAAGTMPCLITKRSTDGTPGSAALTAITPCKESTDAAGNTGSVSTVGTANYTTLGTTAGVAAAGRVQFTALATGVAAVPYIFQPVRPIALKAGTTEEFTIELGGAAVPSGAVLDWEVVTEEV